MGFLFVVFYFERREAFVARQLGRTANLSMCRPFSKAHLDVFGFGSACWPIGCTHGIVHLMLYQSCILCDQGCWGFFVSLVGWLFCWFFSFSFDYFC